MKTYLQIPENWFDAASDRADSSLLAQKALGYLQNRWSIEIFDGRISIDSAFNDLLFPRISFFTSGSSGQPSRVTLCTKRLKFAVGGLLDRIGHDPMHVVCCLPVWHISGWMQLERAWATGGKVRFAHYSDFFNESFSPFARGAWVSLVPTQLHLLLRNKIAVKALRKTNGIFVGGAKLSHLIEKEARREELPIFPCYGMTETGAMVTILDSKDFLDGQSGVGKCLNHAEIKIGEESQIHIRSQSMCLTKDNTNIDLDSWLKTSDLGALDSLGFLTFLGRNDRTINSGGIKVNPETVEAKILSSGMVESCVVLGEPNLKWGHEVVAYVTPSTVNAQDLQAKISKELKRAYLPKKIIPTSELPLNSLGKSENLSKAG